MEELDVLGYLNKINAKLIHADIEKVCRFEIKRVLIIQIRPDLSKHKSK